MPMGHKISQYRALLGFAPPGEVPQSACAQAGNMARFYTPNSGWLPSGPRGWSPRTKWQSIIVGSPQAQVARRIIPDNNAPS